ncbi:MAG: biotin/lipoyl-containing protein, partial [Longimicrobiales bacterium]
MPTKVHIEALSPTMEEGQLVRWLKNEGDTVKEGDVLAEIETDKATMELVARGSGVLRARLIEEGKTAPVGTVIGVIAGPDEDISALTGGAAAPAKQGKKGEGEGEGEGEGTKKPSKKPKQDSAAVAVAARGQTEQPREASIETETAGRETGREEERKAGAETAGRETGRVEEGKGGAQTGDGRGRVKASPLARRLAAESGVELTDISGSGPGGRIIRRDIDSAGARAPGEAKPAAA